MGGQENVEKYSLYCAVIVFAKIGFGKAEM